MLRRGLAAASLATAIMGASPRADASGAWASGASLQPVEQRVAISAGPQRVTLWTSLRFSSQAGPMVIIVPAPPGSALDFTSDAWFEALEIATAPRIFPPAGVSPFCPGKSGSPNIFQIDGLVGHAASLAPQEVAVLDDATKVVTWAKQAGVTLPPAVAAELVKLSDVRFLGVAFNAPNGTGITPTLRVSMPSSPPSLPLTLTRAGVQDLRVTAWTIGPGRGNFIGATEVTLSPSSLVWSAKENESDYDARRAEALASDPARFLVEAAGHGPLADSTPIASGTATIDAVVSTFFERAAAYGDGNFDAAACITVAEAALEASLPVAEVCPQASIGLLPPLNNCSESPGAGKTNPSALRCGPGADDLAVALSGVVPAASVITRHALVIPTGGAGFDWPLGFPPKPNVSPVLVAGSVDYDDCNKEGGPPDGGMMSSSSSSSGGVSTGGPIIHDYSGDPGSGVYIEVDLDDLADVSYYDEGCSCSGGYDGPSYESPDSCDGDASSADFDSCSGDATDDSSCSGDSVDTESCSSSGGDSCSGGDGLDSCDAGGGSSGCSGGGGSGCSGGSSFDCSTARGGRRARGPKFSILLVCAIAVLAPLRRRGTKKAREAQRVKKQG